MSRLALIPVGVACLALMASCLAMAQETASDQPLKLVEQAFAKTKTAKTAAEYTEIIELLENALGGELPAAKVQYAKKLLGWALNRRGEAQATAAERAQVESDAEQSRRLAAAATADFLEAVKADSTHWKALHNRGVNFAQQGKHQEAVADFSRAIQINAKYANTWFNRGEIHYDQGQFEKALGDYNQALALSPGDAGALTSRGHAHFQLGRYREALADYEQAVVLNPKDASALTNRGDAHQSLAQWEQAATDYREAISLDPLFARAHECAGWLAATCPDERFRNAAQALEAAQKAIELSGEDSHTLDALAAAQASASRFDEAQATLAKAIKSVSDSEAAHLKQRLELYVAKKPFRQPAAAKATEK